MRPLDGREGPRGRNGPETPRTRRRAGATRPASGRNAEGPAAGAGPPETGGGAGRQQGGGAVSVTAVTPVLYHGPCDSRSRRLVTEAWAWIRTGFPIHGLGGKPTCCLQNLPLPYAAWRFLSWGTEREGFLIYRVNGGSVSKWTFARASSASKAGGQYLRLSNAL